jgi:hypothetical protein
MNRQTCANAPRSTKKIEPHFPGTRRRRKSRKKSFFVKLLKKIQEEAPPVFKPAISSGFQTAAHTCRTGAYQHPFQAHFGMASQAESSKSHGLFDDSENRLDPLLPLFVFGTPLFGCCPVLHLLLDCVTTMRLSISTPT